MIVYLYDGGWKPYANGDESREKQMNRISDKLHDGGKEWGGWGRGIDKVI